MHAQEKDNMEIKNLNQKYLLQIGIVYVYTTFNNTLMTVTDIKGKTLIFTSAGFLGLKGVRRSTAYAGQTLTTVLSKNMSKLGIRFIQIRLKGFGNARKSVLKGFAATNLEIISIKDFTSIAHNGCRRKKKRRI
ncbi:ribosomal protein S11 (mitochondrion) [Hemiselmis andersenii]|uniref:Ribosomal protein S11 n=1 Tax=Hemiselmis andersenii TaxID=464988 RepID=B2MWT6_HEMAN|nr:ribosomal protein S11 [Hemiselmis andersenii]ACC78228.1 ribosomal protein S11 [Hemiselmis andersenii]